MTNNPRSPAAQRMRLHRERRRRGLRCLMIQLRETEVDALIRGGLLEYETRNDRNAIVKALYSHFSRTLTPATVTRNSATDDCQSNT
jgi:hypothetical protein